MLVFGGLAGPQLMFRLEMLSLSALTYVTAPGAGGQDRRGGGEYSIVYILSLESEK